MSHTPASHSESHMDDGLRLIRQCPLCQDEYKKNALAIVEEFDGARMVHMTCDSCTNAVLAVVVVSPLGTSSVGIVTDLTAEDTQRLCGRTLFTEDDVLDFYSGMQRGGFETHLLQHEQLMKTFR